MRALAHLVTVLQEAAGYAQADACGRALSGRARQEEGAWQDALQTGLAQHSGCTQPAPSRASGSTCRALSTGGRSTRSSGMSLHGKGVDRTCASACHDHASWSHWLKGLCEPVSASQSTPSSLRRRTGKPMRAAVGRAAAVPPSPAACWRRRRDLQPRQRDPARSAVAARLAARDLLSLGGQTVQGDVLTGAQSSLHLLALSPVARLQAGRCPQRPRGCPTCSWRPTCTCTPTTGAACPPTPASWPCTRPAQGRAAGGPGRPRAWPAAAAVHPGDHNCRAHQPAARPVHPAGR